MKTNIFKFIGIFIFLYSCADMDRDPLTITEVLPDNIVFDADDPVLNFIKSERVEAQDYPDTLHCNGVVQTPPQSVFSVYSLVRGFVQDITVYPGSSVKKGQMLCKISHPEIYSLQQKLLSDFTQYRTDSIEYIRQKALLADSATSARQFEIAKSSYFNSLASYSAIEQLVKSLGFDVKKIINGYFYSEVIIRSPADGIVSTVSTNSGALIESNTLLFTIVNTSHIHIEIFLQPNLFSKVKNVDFVYYKSVSDPTIKRAKIVNISNVIEDLSKSVVLHCHVAEDTHPMIVGESVSSYIITDYIRGYDVPRSSIFHFDNKDYVFMQKDNQTFILKEVFVKRKFASSFIVEFDADVVYPIVTLGAEIIKEKLMADE